MGFNRQQDSCCLERSRESTTYLPWWGLEEEEADLPEVKEMDKATSDNVNTNWMFSSLTLHQLSKLNKLYINCLKPASTIGYDTCPFKAYFVLEVNKCPRVDARYVVASRFNSYFLLVFAVTKPTWAVTQLMVMLPHPCWFYSLVHKIPSKTIQGRYIDKAIPLTILWWPPTRTTKQPRTGQGGGHQDWLIDWHINRLQTKKIVTKMI